MATFLLYSPSYVTGNATGMNAVLASGKDAAEARAAADALPGGKEGESCVRDGWEAVRLGGKDLPPPLHPAVRLVGKLLLPADPLPGA